MKKASVLFLSLLPLLLIADETKQAKKESRDFAKSQIGDVQGILLQKGKNQEFTSQDLVPETDRGQSFDGEKALAESKRAPSSIPDSELQAFHKSLLKAEEFEGTEDFFAQGSAILQKPSLALGELKTQNKDIPAEERLVSCLEAGTFQATIQQRRVVTVTPGVRRQVKSCSGHTKKKKFQTLSEAEERLARKKEKLATNTTIASISGFIETKKFSFERIMTWKHHDNTPGCTSYSMRDEVVEAAKEEDLWEPENPEDLDYLEKSPHCKLLQAQMIPSPETKTIQGRPVYRDSWMRELLFSCETDDDSPCAKLRHQGGVLMSKKCQEENSLGECDQWEKVYDLGKFAAYRQSALSIGSTSLWETDDPSEFSSNKSTDFGSSLTTLSIFADMEKQLEDDGSDFDENRLKLFKGDKQKCHRTFLQGAIFDCCSKMKGLATQVKLAACNTEEKQLAESRSDGKCRFIGSYKQKLGTVTTQVFCCFPTKLARVLHEQGRKQLGLKWGNAEKPKCRGFTLRELQRIDFTKIDLSEVVDDLQIRREELAQKLQAAAEQLQTKMQSETQGKASSLLPPELEGDPDDPA